MLATLSAQYRFALAFRVHDMKTDAGRRRRIEHFVAMLQRGETIHPQGRLPVDLPAGNGEPASPQAIRGPDLNP